MQTSLLSTSCRESDYKLTTRRMLCKCLADSLAVTLNWTGLRGSSSSKMGLSNFRVSDVIKGK